MRNGITLPFVMINFLASKLLIKCWVIRHLRSSESSFKIEFFILIFRFLQGIASRLFRHSHWMSWMPLDFLTISERWTSTGNYRRTQRVFYRCLLWNLRFPKIPIFRPFLDNCMNMNPLHGFTHFSWITEPLCEPPMPRRNIGDNLETCPKPWRPWFPSSCRKSRSRSEMRSQSSICFLRNSFRWDGLQPKEIMNPLPG